MAAQVQAKPRFRGLKIPSGSRLWSARNYWARYAPNRMTTSAINHRSKYILHFNTVPQSPIPFLKIGYAKTKRWDKLKPKAFLWFFHQPFGKAPS